MPFTDLLAADRIVLLVEPTSRDAVLDAAARLLAANSPVATQLVADGLRAREQLGSTGIGHGVAIPHCRTAALHEPRAAFLRLSAPIDFAARDGEWVDLVFAMSVPENMAQDHLQTLSELAELFASADFRDALRATDAPGLRALLLGPAPAAPRGELA
jgi:nitrogen PTS system EIIA component